MSKKKEFGLGIQTQKVQEQFEIEKADLNLEDYEISNEEIGKGSQGKVVKAFHKPTQATHAIKLIPILSEVEARKLLEKEIIAMRSCQHANIVRYYGSAIQQNTLYMALEYMDKGSLKDLLLKYGTLKEEALAYIAWQVLTGLCYLHKIKRIVHRDIKPANILINSQGGIQISDFGVCAELKDTTSITQTYVGTITYMSPERIEAGNHGFASDVWSLGITLMECAIGRFPYQAENSQNIEF